jgi:hypothetical protein
MEKSKILFVGTIVLVLVGIGAWFWLIRSIISGESTENISANISAPIQELPTSPTGLNPLPNNPNTNTPQTWSQSPLPAPNTEEEPAIDPNRQRIMMLLPPGQSEESRRFAIRELYKTTRILALPVISTNYQDRIDNLSLGWYDIVIAPLGSNYSITSTTTVWGSQLLQSLMHTTTTTWSGVFTEHIPFAIDPLIMVRDTRAGPAPTTASALEKYLHRDQGKSNIARDPVILFDHKHMLTHDSRHLLIDSVLDHALDYDLPTWFTTLTYRYHASNTPHDPTCDLSCHILQKSSPLLIWLLSEFGLLEDEAASIIKNHYSYHPLPGMTAYQPSLWRSWSITARDTYHQWLAQTWLASRLQLAHRGTIDFWPNVISSFNNYSNIQLRRQERSWLSSILGTAKLIPSPLTNIIDQRLIQVLNNDYNMTTRLYQIRQEIDEEE